MVMPKVTVNSQDLFFAFRKNATAVTPLLFLHGAGGSHLDWPPSLQRIQGTAVYNLDLPGHGRSAPPGCNSINAYAEIVAAFIDELHLQQVVLIGHSMGGAIAQQLTLHQHPALIGLILIGTSARLRVSPILLESIQTEFTTAATFIGKYGWGPTAPKQMVTLSQEQLLDNDSAVVYNDFLACDQFDIRAEVNKIELPTLVIAATEDKMTPLKFGRSLAESIPGAELVVIEGVGHFIAQERPGEVATAVINFLQNHIQKVSSPEAVLK